MRYSKRITAVLTVFALLAAACGGNGSDEPTTTQAATAAPPSTTTTMMEETTTTMMEETTTTMMEEPMLPGEGVSVTMARANWSTGYFQAELARQLMQMLGYEVSDPADAELGPSLAYLAMAQGDADFWVNSWYPGHNSWLEAEMPDGSEVGDHVRAIGNLMTAGGLQGLLITKSFAEEYGINTLDDLNSNADAIAAYDADDANPGNGIADIYDARRAGPATTSSPARSPSPAGKTSSRCWPATMPCLPRPSPRQTPANRWSPTHGHRART